MCAKLYDATLRMHPKEKPENKITIFGVTMDVIKHMDIDLPDGWEITYTLSNQIKENEAQ